MLSSNYITFMLWIGPTPTVCFGDYPPEMDNTLNNIRLQLILVSVSIFDIFGSQSLYCFFMFVGLSIDIDFLRSLGLSTHFNRVNCFDFLTETVVPIGADIF